MGSDVIRATMYLGKATYWCLTAIEKCIDKEKHPDIVETIEIIATASLGCVLATGLLLLSTWIFTVVDPLILGSIFTFAVIAYVGKKEWDYIKQHHIFPD